MLDFLYTPVPFWVFGISAISTMWELRKYQKKKISVKVKKNKVLAKLNEEVFIFPKQEEIDLSKYDEKKWLITANVFSILSNEKGVEEFDSNKIRTANKCSSKAEDGIRNILKLSEFL